MVNNRLLITKQNRRKRGNNLKGGKGGRTRRAIKGALSRSWKKLTNWWNSLNMDEILNLPPKEPPSIIEDGQVESKGEKDGVDETRIIVDDTEPLAIPPAPEPPPTIQGIGAEPIDMTDNDEDEEDINETDSFAQAIREQKEKLKETKKEEHEDEGDSFEKELQKQKERLRPTPPSEPKPEQHFGPAYLDDEARAKILKRREAIGEGYGIIRHRHPLIRAGKRITNPIVLKRHWPRIIF